MPDATRPERPAPARPAVIKQLRSKGPDTLGQETNLARAPLWEARQRPVQLDLLAPTVLYGRPFRQIAGKPLTVTDQRLFAELTTAYLLARCPDDRRVPFSLGAAARLLGHAKPGGEDRRLVRASLTRLRSCTIESAVRYRDDQGVRQEETLVWGLIDSARTTTRGGGRGLVILSEQVAELLRRGSVTYLHAPTWDAIAAEDEMAGRLWTFLETERLERGWQYQLFAARPGELVAAERNMPAIAELLRIDGWKVRRHVASRVARACAVIVGLDPRYELTLAKSRDTGMWRLAARRGDYQGLQPRGFGGLPRLVVGAWANAYGARRPSKKQVATLLELTSRRGPVWVATNLRAGVADPFRAALEADAQERRAALAAADQHEQEWAAEKARLAGDATVLADVLQGVLAEPDDEA